MKVVLFCKGLSMRLREYSENIPKPMVKVGYQPECQCRAASKSCTTLSGRRRCFLANYSDGLSDLPLDSMIEHFYTKDKIASFMAYQSTQIFYMVRMTGDDSVSSINPISKSDLWINCGYFALRKEIFDYIHPGDELVEKPFQRLIANNQLAAYPHNGFLTAMDTFKDKQTLDDMHAKGNTSWHVWKKAERETIASVKAVS